MIRQPLKRIKLDVNSLYDSLLRRKDENTIPGPPLLRKIPCYKDFNHGKENKAPGPNISATTKWDENDFQEVSILGTGGFAKGMHILF